MSYHVASLIAEYYNNSTGVMKHDVAEYLPQLCPELVAELNESHLKSMGVLRAVQKFDASVKEADKALVEKRREIETEVVDIIARVEAMRRTLDLPGNEDAFDIGTMTLDSLERVVTLLTELSDCVPEMDCSEVIEILKDGGG